MKLTLEELRRLEERAADLVERAKAADAAERAAERSRRRAARATRSAAKKLERKAAMAVCGVRVGNVRKAERDHCAKKASGAKRAAPPSRERPRRIRPRPVSPGRRAPELVGAVVPRSLPSGRSTLLLPPAPPRRKVRVAKKAKRASPLAPSASQRRSITKAIRRPTTLMAAKSARPAATVRDPSAMSAAAINKELDRLDIAASRNTDAFIKAGRGHERPSEYLKMTDPLSIEAQRIFSRFSLLRDEIDRRYGPGAPPRLPRGLGPIDGSRSRRRRGSNP